ncbi:xanthine dehydrogenase family protein molybdopterin-binding subunit [Mucilaginibacter daejeonensis]|uniref:xanthine dehydrogenase family protein molybdopterin-binding subunit n=1 Tax=Mucilaginibacter daejeonensis TaxID=398049 RepID=UPI001D176E8C|nr:xanthine dehydrogenase family protein molybdopterin-binding subunit [Mucilaginibacter daejeonensis]UEG52154.1 xanthine dehydrogenase family protein molybdopterin-binding subunit [Mucilaginibacter daejeonensis]
MGIQKQVGQPVSRLEGKAKVTGTAKYAAEYNVPGLLYAYVVNSTITKGKILSIDTDVAKAINGVVDILTHDNRPKLAWFDLQYADMDAPPGTVLKPLHDTDVKFYGQPVALVVANDLETARYAATLVKVEYEKDAYATNLTDNLKEARPAKKGMATALKPPPPAPVGDFVDAYAKAPFKVDATYQHGTEHHNPMEMFATTTVHEGDGKLTIYDKTQGTINNQLFVANVFGLSYKDVRVLAPYVGGAFGLGLRPQYQLFLCVMAALHLKRNVRLTLDRQQMFALGHRPQNLQQLRFATDESGKLSATAHSAFVETSNYEDYTEVISGWSHKLYPSPNTLFQYNVVPLDTPTPIDMRAPGGSTALHAIECTMDQLAYALNVDPLELRLRNYADIDSSTGNPFTSKALRECYLSAAERFGWSERDPRPGSMTRGNKLVGYGMATGIWDAYQFPSRVKATITAEGKLIIDNAVTDIGTGTLTVMTQIAADELGLSLEDVTFAYGDSKKPFSMFQGGSSTTSSTGVAIVMAANALKKKLLKIAKGLDGSPFSKADVADLVFRNGGISLVNEPSVFISFVSLVASNKGRPISTTNMGRPHMLKLRKYSKMTHSASFVEVEVDKELKVITVKRAVTAVAAGTIVNPKTATSQISGSMVWGISKALHEETITDPNLGKYMNTNLGEYHIPTHADIGQLEVIFADEKDEMINELGIKGVGEIGLVGMPAAIANAIFHATGKRINKLPIHFDELLDDN